MSSASDPRLKAEIETIELIDSEIAGLREDRRERMAGIKAMGYDLVTVRKLLARRGMSPAERGEADALLETYEAALGMEAGFVPSRLIDAAELAALLLADQVEGLTDPARAELLVGHVLALLDFMAEQDSIRGMMAARRKLAVADGFPANPVTSVVRWYRKVAKHGLAEMRLGEELFRAFRSTVDEAGGVERPRGDSPTADEKLAALFAKPAPKAPTAKQRAVAEAIALARLNQPKSDWRGGM